MTLNQSARKFPFWATFYTLIAFLILCALGTWQVQRANWKKDLLSDLDNLATAAAQPGDSTLITALLSAPARSLFHGRLALSGHYLPSQFQITPRMNEGALGYHLITPLRLEDGGLILINRGWVDKDTPPPATPQGAVKVTGLLRTPEKPGFFTPPNEAANNVWYHIDIPAMQEAAGLEYLLPALLYAQEEDPASPALTYHQARPTLPDNHLSYAFFWFSMAGVLLVIYYFRFIRRPRA